MAWIMRRRTFITAVAGSALAITPVIMLANKFGGTVYPKRSSVASDWTVTTSGNIRYIGDTDTDNTYTIRELHAYLQTLDDDASELDAHAMTINPPYNIDDAAAMHLKDGSISQRNGKDIYQGFFSWGDAPTGPQFIFENSAC